MLKAPPFKSSDLSIDRVQLKNQLAKILQVIIPSIFSPFFTTLPTSTLATFKIEQKSIVHKFWQQDRFMKLL